jgi:hypothetical protein
MIPRNSYEPCFATVPETSTGRWELLREFTRRWHGIALAPVDRISSLVYREQATLSIRLPTSFREYIAFAEELTAQAAFGILRDTYDVCRLEEHSATSLLLQCEGDVYWAVKDENLIADDPAVEMYYLDYDNDERFVHGGTEWPTITSFVLGHMAHYLNGAGGGCLVSVEATDGLITELNNSFAVHSQLGNIQIFEKQDVIVLLVPNSFERNDHHMFVEVFRPMPLSEIPECILKHTMNGGAFHGMFASRLQR